MTRTRIPRPCVCVLIGPAGSGKTTWADRQFRPGEVLSSDRFRALVGEGEDDQSATDAAFALIEQAGTARLARGLTTVLDTTGLDASFRRRWQAAARDAGMPVFAVVFDAPAALLRSRIRNRRRQVPVRVVDAQRRSFRAQRDAILDEGWDDVVVVTPEDTVDVVTETLVVDDPTPSIRDSSLRFGLHISSFGLGGGPGALAERLAAIARAAEEVGFHSIRVMDHPVQIPQVGRHFDDILEPFTTLAMLAGVTDRVRLGPLVAGVTYRNIALLGKTVASLDVLSGGRAECGLGLGWYERDHLAYGYRLPSVAERYALLRDALEFLPVLWGPGAKAWSGRTFETPEALCYPRPLQDALPIIVGGQGERVTLRLVAEHGVGCNLFGEPDTVAHKLGVLASHAATFDRDPATITVTHLSEALVGEDEAGVEALVDEFGPRQRKDAWRNRVHAGTADDQVRRFRALAAAGVDEAIVALVDLRDSGAVERFAPVVAAFG